MHARNAWSITKETANQWIDDDCMRLSAALSYYTIFSLGPLLILAISVAGFFLGAEAARGELSYQLTGLLGEEGAKAVEGIVAGAREEKSGVIATIVGFVILIIGATGVFAELKSALNFIWHAAPPKSSGVVAFLRARLLSFAMVLAIGFLLLVSLLLNAAVAITGKFMNGFLPLPEVALQGLTTLASFLVITILFALIFKVLPDKDVKWRDVWIGAAITSVLFSIGKLLIGLYLGKSSVASTFGASGSVVIILVWSYYSSLILFIGAEFTEVYSRRHGSRRDSRAPASGQRLRPARA